MLFMMCVEGDTFYIGSLKLKRKNNNKYGTSNIFANFSSQKHKPT